MGRRQRRAQERIERQESIARGALLIAEDKRNAMPEVYFREKVEAMEKLQRNGITVADLKENYDKGYTDGFKAAGEPIVKGCYAAVCLALNDLHGFGQKRCAAVLRSVDEHMRYSLTSQETIEEVWQRMGLRLEFKEVFDRIVEVEG